MADLLISSLDQKFQKKVSLPAEGVMLVGREDNADIQLPRNSVSRNHARVHCKGETIELEDSGSRNGVMINNTKLEGTQQLNHGDKVLIGEFAMLVQLEESEFELKSSDPGVEAEASTALVQAIDAEPGSVPFEDSVSGLTKGPLPPPKSSTLMQMAVDPDDPFGDPAEQAKAGTSDRKRSDVNVHGVDPYVALRRDVHQELISRMDLRQLNLNELGTDEVRIRTQRVVEQIIFDFEDEGKLDKKVDKNLLLKDVLDEALGLGPLEDLLEDETISEIMVNNKDQIYVEQSGKLTLSAKKFISDGQIRAVIERIVAPLGRRIDESSPMVDARLADGSRVNAIIPPLAIKGSSITIRKFSKDPLRVKDLVKFGAFTQQMADFFKMAVEAHQNIVISGGTGSGKTTLLNVMSSFIGETERIVTVEDAAELQLLQPHVVSLEARPANIEGKGAVHIRDLVKNCLRMRPDRIVIGECRGGEALDMLQAMNTGHDGSLTTGHANSPREMLSRIETMVLMAGMDLPVRAIREQISSAVHMIVQQARLSDGSRKVIQVDEVTGMEGDVITTQTIFKFEQSGFDEKGKIVGRIVPSGFIPSFVEKLRAKGVEVPLTMFQG
jgi:pilus assembly protein CpaF